MAWIVGGAAALIVLLVSGIAVAAWAMFAPTPRKADSGATCVERMGSSCTDIPLEVIEKVTKVDLPDGTTVVSSKFDQFQDWHLEAVVDLPAGAPDPMARPEVTALYDDKAHDGVYYQHQRTVVDGRTRLTLTVFTM